MNNGVLMAYTIKQQTPREMSFPEWEGILRDAGLDGYAGRQRNRADAFKKETQALDNLKMDNGETGDERRIFRFYLCKIAEDPAESQRILAYAEIDEFGKEVAEGVNLFRFTLDKEAQKASYEPLSRFIPSRFIKIAEKTVNAINLFGGVCSSGQIRTTLTRALEAHAIPTGVTCNWIFGPDKETQANAFFKVCKALNDFMGEKFITMNFHRLGTGQIFEGLTVEEQITDSLVSYIGADIDSAMRAEEKAVSETAKKSERREFALDKIQKRLEFIKEKVAGYRVPEKDRVAINEALEEAKEIAIKAMKTEEVPA